MKKLLALVLACMMLTPMTALGEAGKVSIGVAQFAEHGSLDNCREGFLLGLAEEGFVEGENLTVDYQNAQADMGIANQIAQSFASRGMNLVCAIATPMAQASFNACEAKDIPVIYTAVTDPIAAQLADENGTNARPITGTSDKLPVAGQLELIRAMMPGAKTIGILYTTSETNSLSSLKEYEALAGDYGFAIESQPIDQSADLPLALSALLPKVDCLSNLTDNTVVNSLPLVLDRANAEGKPVFGSEVEQVVNGCVAAAGLDYVALGKQTGKMAARVLKGENAGSIPFETISEFAFYVNPQAMASLNLKAPETLADKMTDVTAP